MMKHNEIILVDENDIATGTMEKLEAHRKALLHRAVSVFIFNSKGEWLLQQRASDKYHSGSLWTNTCCTHPYQGESNFEAANRRLAEEMGIQCQLQEVFQFIYKEPIDNDLTEHELDHVFVGVSDELPQINTEEVMNFKYLSTSELKGDLAANSGNYTVWFRKIVNHYEHKFIKP